MRRKSERAPAMCRVPFEWREWRVLGWGGGVLGEVLMGLGGLDALCFCLLFVFQNTFRMR